MELEYMLQAVPGEAVEVCNSFTPVSIHIP